MRLKAKLHSRRSIHGIFLPIGSPDLVEIAGAAGLDYIVIDCEHGSITEADVVNMLRAAQCSGVSALVRVPANQPFFIGRYLDAGAEGLVIPGIESAEEATSAVVAACSPPRGRRGLAGTIRACRYGLVPLAKYLSEESEDTVIVAQIESARSLSNVDAILDVEGIDLFYLGPTDLSLSLGYEGRPVDDELRLKMREVVTKITLRGALAGIAVGGTDDARFWEGQGVRLLAFNAVSLIMRAFRGVSAN